VDFAARSVDVAVFVLDAREHVLIDVVGEIGLAGSGDEHDDAGQNCETGTGVQEQIEHGNLSGEKRQGRCGLGERAVRGLYGWRENDGCERVR
jgi:hypothetical protein